MPDISISQPTDIRCEQEIPTVWTTVVDFKGENDCFRLDHVYKGNQELLRIKRSVLELLRLLSALPVQSSLSWMRGVGGGGGVEKPKSKEGVASTHLHANHRIQQEAIAKLKTEITWNIYQT
jgi:hypothetical protein